MNVPREMCTDGYCHNGGNCTMFTQRATCMWVTVALDAAAAADDDDDDDDADDDAEI